MPLRQVVTCSTREGRLGEPLATWVVERAKAHGKFEVEAVDLRAEALPLFDEAQHPRFGKYEHEHTKRWSAKVARADAFVFVTPEYNFGMPPSLLNALTYLHKEWQHKAAGFVSYGGVSAGTRAVQHAKAVMVNMKLVPIFESVNVPFFLKAIENGTFTGGETQDKAATAMLDELARWTSALAV